MRFMIETRDDGMFNVVCNECVCKVKELSSTNHQEISDAVNAHAFMSHRQKRYGSVNIVRDADSGVLMANLAMDQAPPPQEEKPQSVDEVLEDLSDEKTISDDEEEEEKEEEEDE